MAFNRASLLPVALAGMATLIIAAIGATITDLSPWYRSLAQPSWAPPDWLYGVAWTLIFACAALSAMFAWEKAPDNATGFVAFGLFAFNGSLNLLWSALFFQFRRPDWALYECALLWLSIVVLIVYCGRFSKLSVALLIPYLIWVSVAAALNYEIVALNGPFG